MILVYETDPTLLHLRCLILERATRRDVKSVATGQEVRAELERKDRQYSLLFICHTVPSMARVAAHELGQEKGIPVYQLERLAPPDQWAADISRMLQSPRA